MLATIHGVDKQVSAGTDTNPTNHEPPVPLNQNEQVNTNTIPTDHEPPAPLNENNQTDPFPPLQGGSNNAQSPASF